MLRKKLVEACGAAFLGPDHQKMRQWLIGTQAEFLLELAKRVVKNLNHHTYASEGLFWLRFSLII